MKKLTRILALVLALVLVLGVFGGCKRKPADGSGTTDGGKNADGYTYRDYTSQLGVTWNPHAYDTDYDRNIMQYLVTPLATAAIKNSEEGSFQWVFKAAESITDVTKDHTGDLTKYKATLPDGKTAEQVDAGYVFEIKLNDKMKWQDGTAINADSYIYSMKALLDPTMKNYRANLYYSGESAVAGGYTYYHSLDKELYDSIAYSDATSSKNRGKVCMDTEAMKITGYSDTKGNALPKYLFIDDETIYNNAEMDVVSGRKLFNDKKRDFEKGTYSLFRYSANENYNENYAETYDALVGCYKVDDYTIRYVTQTAIDINYFLTSCSSNWLVHKDLYDAGKDTSGKLVTTNYATDIANTMSYGPYKIESLQKGKQIVLVQNENYYEFTKKEDGTLYAETAYEVDGEKVQAWQTTKIVIDQMADEAAKQAFLKGELSKWVPTADEMPTYNFSEQMYRADETYTMALFFNTNLDALKEMDKSKGNQNSVVLSNTTFRKAFSLAVDREDWVTATAGYKPAYTLMNDQFYYDIYKDPTSTYRGTSMAMDAMCKLYGVGYVDGTTYATVEEAYASITGYNLTKAKELMKQACTELVNAGLYTKGQDIKILVAYSGGELDSSSRNQITKLNEYLNEAMADSGFGKITLEGVGNVPSRHGKIGAGEYAIGYGGWGGAAFYPFRNFQVYCDTQQYDIHEAGCWNPATETLTIKIDGENVTKTWQDWSRSMVGTGPYANAVIGTKLEITSTMERELLAKYYRIPLASSCIANLLSYQVNNYTDAYNIMYDFGGLELMNYNYTDAKWAEHVASIGGTLNYE